MRHISTRVIGWRSWLSRGRHYCSSSSRSWRRSRWGSSLWLIVPWGGVCSLMRRATSY